VNAIDPARRAFLRGALRPRPSGITPPWAGADFSDRCVRCDDCVRACSADILVRGDGGFPRVDFDRGGCTFCGACVTACRHDALVREDAGDVVGDAEPPWHTTVAVGSGCLSMRGVTCRSCGDACETGAIRFRLQPGGRALAVVDDSLCNGCGSCIATCPVRAIQIEEAA
jgi:ferredoxin-type protein NapF